jgi:hypothetical protein
VKIDVTQLIASPGYAPRAWQSKAPTEASWGRKPEVQTSEDLRRIIALPYRDQLEPLTVEAQAMIHVISERYSSGRAAGAGCNCREGHNRECITTLRLAQAWALYEIGIVGGLLGPIGVGHGKTMLDLLAPLAFQGCRTAVLLVPPNLVTQLIADYDLTSNHFRVPSIVVHGAKAWANRVPGAPVVHVFPYSRLSNKEATVFLETLKPDVVIADEVHNLRHAEAVRTARVLRYFAAHQSTRFAGWSGSMTDASVKDYAHLSALALRENSPLPLNPEVVEDWARALDPQENPAPAGALLEMCEPGEHIHSGFHRRLCQTMGVVATMEPSVDCELEIEERKAPPVPPDVAAALDELRSDWVRPDGEELVDALSVNRCALELACGLYYRWRFPRIGGEPQRKSVIAEWFEARKEWRRELRFKAQRREPHLDSPELCANAAARAWRDLPANPDLPVWHADTWPRWARVKDLVRYEPEAVRLDDFLARDAADWALANRGIVWYMRSAFGAWVAELSGLPMHAGGPNAGAMIKRERGDRSIIASIKSHGTGRDGLQFLFDDQLIANPSSSNAEWEQLLGRLHRTGQRAPVVHAKFYRHTAEMAAHVGTALRRALYVGTTMGSGQKIRLGWDDEDLNELDEAAAEAAERAEGMAAVRLVF